MKCVQKGKEIMAAKKKSKLKIIVIVLILCVIGGAAAIFAMAEPAEEPAAEKKTETAKYINPLTGEASETEIEAGRPLVVSIDNVGDAIPQSWLSVADMVYEFSVEGRQTRLQAIYYSEFPEEFGPIRSVRPYFVDLAREYKAIHLGHGWSDSAKSYLLSGVVPYINGMNSELDFYRSTEKTSPHDSYLAWSEVKSKIDEKGWWDEKQEIRAFQFLEDGEVAPGEYAGKVSFNYGASKCEFTYDRAKNTYVRTINGSEYIDLETGEPIETTNILVQKVSSSVLDSKGRLKINMCAGGSAMLFTNGKVVTGTWSRSDLDSRTIFVDEDGNEFKLGVGTTWVEVADQGCSVTYDAPADPIEALDLIDIVKGTPAKITAAMAEEE